MITITFLKYIEFGRRNRVKNFIFEEESILILELIPTVAFDKANSKPQQDSIILPLV